jgi:hypothetical protein
MRGLVWVAVLGGSVVPSSGLHSGLRQSGAGLRPGFYGTTEAVPFRVVVGCLGCGGCGVCATAFMREVRMNPGTGRLHELLAIPVPA